MFDPEREGCRSAAALDVERVVTALGRSVGAPWTNEHRLAASEALPLLARLTPNGLLLPT